MGQRLGLVENIKLHKSGDGYEIITQNSYGYGDIIRAVAYASLIKRKVLKDVSVRYVVDPVIEKSLQMQNTSAQTYIDSILEHYINPIRYEVEHCSIRKYATKYTRLFRKEHAEIVGKELGYPKLMTRDQSFNLGYLCVWTPWNNLVPVAHDKMPINKNIFNDFIKTLDIPVKMVDYRMPIDYVFQTIRHSKMCLGYEGLGQQIAYHYHKKMITLSNWEQVSRNTGGPNSIITNDLEKVIKYVND